MLIFLEYKSWDLVLEKIAEDQNLCLSDLLAGKKLSIPKVTITDKNDLLQIFQGQDVFSEVASSVFLVDIDNLSISKDFVEFLEKLDHSQITVYFYSGLRQTFLADEKKLLKKVGETLTLKNFQESTKNTLTQDSQISLTSSQASQLVKRTRDYIELQNVLELIKQGVGIEYILDKYLEKEQRPIWQLSFDLNNLKNDIFNWQDKVDKIEEMQLALAVIFGKLEKQRAHPNFSKIMEMLIDLDLEIKSSQKIDPVSLFKLFLYQVSNLKS